MTRYKVLPEVPTEEMIDATGSRYDDLKEMVVANYKAMYEAAPSVECEPIGWTDKLQLSYLDNGEAMLVYPDTCEAEIPIYTIPQERSAKIAELEAKLKIVEDAAYVLANEADALIAKLRSELSEAKQLLSDVRGSAFQHQLKRIDKFLKALLEVEV